MTPPDRPQRPGDPDPLYVEPGPVPRPTVKPGVPLAVVVYTLGAMVFAGLIVLAAWLLLATPRGGQHLTYVPATSVVDPDAGLPGAPLEREAVASSTSPIDHHDGGSPDVAIAGPLWAGTATWYCGSGSPCTHGYRPGDLVAAIDMDLGISKGATVVVRSQAGPGEVTVRIVDVCACAGERLIDLSAAAFRRLSPLEAGVIAVTLEVVDAESTLPPTGTSP